MLGQSFDQAVRQAHLLYGSPPPSSNFDVEMDMYDGRMLPCREVESLKVAAEETVVVVEGEDS